MKMRELEQRTGVNRETIRVYLREGLLPEPQRPKANVAIYGEEHVQSVLAIRKLQKERRLPLHMIKRALEGDASPNIADAATFPHLINLISARVGFDDALLPLSVTAGRNPKAARDAAALASIGAIELVKRGGKTYLTHIDAELVSLWGDLRAAGFTEEVGFTADFCKLHVDAARKLAQAELKVFLKNLYGRKVQGPAADMAQAALDHLLSIFGLIRMKAILVDLHKLLDSGHAPPTRSTPRSKQS